MVMHHSSDGRLQRQRPLKPVMMSATSVATDDHSSDGRCLYNHCSLLLEVQTSCLFTEQSSTPHWNGRRWFYISRNANTCNRYDSIRRSSPITSKESKCKYVKEEDRVSTTTSKRWCVFSDDNNDDNSDDGDTTASKNNDNIDESDDDDSDDQCTDDAFD
jgi:hypothetical protein